ncbi:MAG: hypothetical protein ACRELG_15365 [Gemmataceae bacterium]
MSRSFERYLFRDQVEALALPCDSTPDDYERYYIRSAVDIMRRAAAAASPGENVAASSTEAETSYKLACYTKAIKVLYDRKDKPPTTADDMTNLVFTIGRIINGGQALLLTCEGQPRENVEAAIGHFAAEMLERLTEPQCFDPVETVALIEYRLRYIRPFFKGTRRSIPEALLSFFLMCDGLRLPEYIDWQRFSKVGRQLLDTKDMQKNIEELVRDIGELRKDRRFTDWVEAFRAQFRPPVCGLAAAAEIPKDPWQVKDSTALDRHSTTYKAEYVTRRPEEIDLLRLATGKRPERLVVFKPERMALHETIAAAVTKMQMPIPTDFLRVEILGPNSLFHQAILPRVRNAFPEERFEEDRRIFCEYVNHIIDDHFHIQNPHMEIRAQLEQAKNDIINRINEGHYKPRLAESRDALHHLVADDLLRQRYQKEVRTIVDQEIEAYLDVRPELRLPLKPDGERLAWVTVGGPASGKSTLERLIEFEYKEFVGSTCPLCQINSDHYKPLLLPKTPDDPEHGARTYWESGQVRQRIIDRLEEMIDREHKAPDFWVSTMTPSPERMKIVGKGGAKVNIYLVSCSVEGESGAVQRAYKRATNADPCNEDYLRFMSTKDILENHRKASELLPAALKAKRRYVRLYSTASWPTVLMASMDSYNREMRIFDAQAFIRFVRKGFINKDASADNQVYRGVSEREVAAALCEYPKANVSLNLRYSQEAPNRIVDRFRKMKDDETNTEKETRELLLESQPETYMWVGHDRAIIRDFVTFVAAFGGQMAEAILIEVGKRWPLSVRDYIGHELLEVDKKGNVYYPSSEDPINRLNDPILRAIIDKAASTLKKEANHEQDRPAAYNARVQEQPDLPAT